MTRRLGWAALPFLLLGLVAALFFAADPLATFTASTPPIESLTVERTTLDEHGIGLVVRADGSAPVEIAQVQVDGAYWDFSQQPPGPIARLASARLQIPYPWVLGETHHLLLLSRTGVPFESSIDVALPTPPAGAGMLATFGWIGLFVGFVPVALGMLFYPALRGGGPRLLAFALAVTVGLLAFLLVDTLAEALQLAAEATPGLHMPALVWLVAGLAFLVLLAAGRRRAGEVEGIALASSIALGIGLHNLGEGLAIGSAYATGAAALGSFLLVGFTLHNVSEGVGIVAPLIGRRPALWVFAALAALAGLPAVLGIWLGAYAFSPHWAALALAVGAGAILQVIVEVTALLLRRARRDGEPGLSAAALAGVAAGVTVMYTTALLIPA